MKMKRYLLTLIPCLALVPLCFIASLGITVATLVKQTPVYRSSTTLEAPPPANDQTIDSYSIQTETDLRIATMPEVVSATRKALSRPVDEITAKLSRIAVKPIRGTRLIRFTVDATDPVFAADFADAWQRTFIEKMEGSDRPGYRQIERPVPSAAPITPRKMETIFRAATLGILTGTLLSLLLAGFIVKMMNKKAANKGLVGTGDPQTVHQPPQP